MHAQQLRAVLASAIKARCPILITGKPGVAKSAITKLAADDAGADFLQSHPAIEDPTDAKGLPNFVDGGAEFIPFGIVRKARAADRLTVWNLEDLGQASPAVQAAYMPLLDAARNGALPHIVFIATTNARTHRAGVSGILEPVKSRFASIIELEADVESWTRWALAAGHIPAELIAFLRFRRELLSAFEPSADLTNSPCPRTWEAAAKLLALDLGKAERAEALAGAVGAGAATEFLAFLDMFRQLPSIDGILLNADAAPIPSEPSALCATVTALAARAGETAFPRVARYAERLQEAGRGDFAAMLVLDATRRHPGAMHTPEFIRLTAGELGTLISGGTR